jgi:hypothetical protein
MANRRDLQTLIVVGALATLVASVGLFLGFHSNRLVPHLAPTPLPPASGPIVYEMSSIRSDPDRVRFEWREVPGAVGYRVTLLTATDDSLFTGPDVETPYWTIPPELRGKLKPQTTYHWRLTVRYLGRGPSVSDPASFATQ